MGILVPPHRGPLMMIAGPMVALTTLSSAALAQQGEPQSVGKEIGADAPVAEGLTEIVVTAQRQSENLQRVPITVTAITAESLEQSGIAGTADLPAAVPGLVLSPQFGYAMFYLRGVGTYNNVGGNESSNAFYIDDLYIPDMPAAFLNFNSIERLEVLKGPQGTLFGRNATGGLIHVITRDPQSDPAADVSLSYGNFETVDAQAYVTGGSERAAADLAVLYRDQGEGWGRNVFNGEEFFDQSLYAVRSKQRLEIGERTRVVGSLFYSDDRNTYSSGRRPLPGALGVGGTPYPGDYYNINFDYPSSAQFRGGGASLTLTHERDWGTFVGISGYQRNDQGFQMDQDSTPLPFVSADIEYTNQYITQELQLRSPENSRVTWLTGLYFLKGDTELEKALLEGLAFNAVGGSRLVTGEQNTESYAAYAQVTVPLGEATRATGGLRFTTEERQLDGQNFSPLTGVTGAVDAQKRWDAWTYRASLDHQITPTVMGYASYNRGFKSGVYNLLTPTNPVVNPETLDAFETGLKTELFDHTVRLNVSGFYYQYDNLQLNTVQLGINTLINAAEATIYGADVDALAEVAPGLTLRAQAEWLHTEYDSFLNAPAQIPAPGTCTPVPQTTGPVVGGNITCTIDASGKRLTSAPATSFTVGANYRFDTSLGEFIADLSYYRTSRIFFQPDNRLSEPAYGLLNASLGVDFSGGRYQVRLWGKNLTDEEYATFITTSTGDAANPGSPRMYGVTLQAHF